MLVVIAFLGFCLITVYMIRGFIAFDDRERLTALVCVFCFIATYLVFDLIAFDPKMRLYERVPDEFLRTNTSFAYYFVPESM